MGWGAGKPVITPSPTRLGASFSFSFIHLTFDIIGFGELRDLCEANGHPFTVDSTKTQKGESFDMGEAAGHFSYIEDPDGALIEFIETHKVPIVKKLGLYLNLKKKNPQKPLSRWILKAFAFNRVKEVC